MNPTHCLFALLCTLFSLSLSAQAYQPVHQSDRFSLRDSTGAFYHLRVSSVSADGPDSLFFFNSVGRKRDSFSTLNCGPDPVDALYYHDRENIWGVYMRKTPTGEYFFTTQDSQVFYLPVNNLSTTFTFFSGFGQTITGSYSTTLFNVSPAYPTDSVRVFTLSNGQEIHVSENNGIFEAFDFMGLTDLAAVTNHFVRGELTLPTVEHAYRDIPDFFDYQAGDIRVMKKTYDYQGLFDFLYIWTVDTIISVTPTPNGISLLVRRSQLIDESPTPASNIDTTFWTPTTTATQTISGNGLMTHEYQSNPSAMLLESRANPLWNNGYSQRYNTSWVLDTCGHINSAIDLFVNETYTHPFGLTLRTTQSFSGLIEELICFTRGGQTWGTCPNWNTIVSQEKAISLNYSLFPNPGSNQLHLRIPGNVPLEASLYDLHGRLLKESDKSQGQIVFETGHLPGGIYLVEVRSGKHVAYEKWVKE